MSAPGLRSRRTIPATTPDDPTASISSPPPALRKQGTNEDNESNRFTVLDALRMLAGAVLLSCAISYFVTGNSVVWGLQRPGVLRPARIKAWMQGPLHLTDAQLALYNGTDPALPILLGLNGSIYDVSASAGTYGPGGSYHFFSGRDATRAFVTGCFDTDLNGDLRGVEEMYIPLDLSIEREEEVKGMSKAERGKWKTERQQARRKAHKQVRETVDGWRKMYDGGKGGKYFRRGTIDRGEGSGWMGWGEVKELCEAAMNGRETRKAEDVGK